MRAGPRTISALLLCLAPTTRAQAPTAEQLAETFCRLARRRIEQRFDDVFDNEDVNVYKTAQRVMADDLRWLEFEPQVSAEA